MQPLRMLLHVGAHALIFVHGSFHALASFGRKNLDFQRSGSLETHVKHSGLTALENPCSREKTDEGPPRALGGAGRDRTDDLRLAKPALSQLSYSPY